MALTFTPGQVISWDDLNAMLAQHGSPQGAKSIRPVAPKPLTEEEKIAIERAGGNPDAPRQPAYQYFMEDGSSFIAELDQPGEQTGDPVAGSGRGSTFRIVDYKPSQTYVAAQRKAETAQEQDAKAPKEGETRGPQTGRKREVWRGGQWVTEDNPLYEAKPGEDPEKPKSQTVTGGDGKPYVVTQTPGADGKPPTVTVTDGAGNPVPGNAVPGKPDATKTPTTAEATDLIPGKPGWRVGKRQTRDANGNEKSETFYINPQGQETLVGPPEDVKPTMIDGKPHRQVVGEDGTVRYEPIPVAGSGVALPPGMARPQFTAGEVANELAATRDKLDAWVAEGKDDTERASRKAEALNAMKEAHQLATTYLTEQQQLQGTATSTFGTQVSQRGQDASMINQRTSAGASMANQAVSSFVPMLRYAQAGSGDPVKAFMALMGLMRENVGAMGGLVDLPRVGVPSAIPQSAQGQPQPAQTGTNVVNGAPSGLPPIVRGAAQQQAAPGVTIQVNAPPPAEAPAAQPLPPPLLGPQPEVQLPPPAVMQKVFDLVEPMMAQDPSWGVDDIGLIQQGVGPVNG